MIYKKLASFITVSIISFGITLSALAVSVSPLTKETPATIPSLSRKSAHYYTFTIPSNILSLSVSTAGQTGDIDVYLNKDKIRTSKISTWRSTKSGSAESITLSRPTAGTYYLTVLAYTASTNTTVSLKYIDATTGITTLLKNVPVQVPPLLKAEERYFSFSVPSGSSNLTVNTTGTTGDADIFLSTSGVPTPKTSLFKSTTDGSNEHIAIMSPLATTYYLTLRAYTSTSNTTVVINYTTPIIPSNVSALPTTPVSPSVPAPTLPSSVGGSVATSSPAPAVVVPVPIVGLCGSSANKVLSSLPGSNLCSSGSPSSVGSNASSYLWTCSGTNGGGTASCTAPRQVTVTATGTWIKIAAEYTNFTVTGTQLVRYGSGSSWVQKTVSGTNPCTNAFFGSDPLVSVVKECNLYTTSTTTVTTPPSPVLTPTNGICGTSANQTLSVPPTSLCTTGTASAVSNTGMYMWTCLGVNGGITASCHADKAVVAIATTAVPIISTGEYLWSDPKTWGGTLPTANQSITIPAGKTIVLDQDTPALGKIIVQGTLRFADKDIALTMLGMTITSTGAFEIGKVNIPYTKKAIITVNGLNNGNATDRGIIVEGGRFELYGTAPSPVWTKINDHAQAASKSLTLMTSTNWKAGDNIILASTELPNSVLLPTQRVAEPTELLTLASSTGSLLTLTQSLVRFHFGKLQYATDQGMSYVKGSLTKTSPDTVDVLDERAEVGNLTRNITIQAPNDTLWQTGGFGVHTMIMGLSSQVRVDGVRFERGGQSGIVARYPIHWHLLSYDPETGNLLGDPVNNYIKNSAITNSMHRCIVIHATNGVTIANNICYNIAGHAIFLEDGSERRNVIEGNLVMKTKRIPTVLATQVHEGMADHCGGGTTGYWLTNPDNTVQGNSSSDSSGNGFWLSYGRKPVKQSKLVPMSPITMNHAPFMDNIAHSNGNRGLMLECSMDDDAGNLTLKSYTPDVPIDVVRSTVYKNGLGAYLNRVRHANYLNWAVADNGSGAFSGAITTGYIKNTLVVGESLNNAMPYGSQNYQWPGPQFGITSYHSTMNNVNNIFVNFKNEGDVNNPVFDGKNSGSLGTNDYYITPVERGLIRSPGNKFINADPGLRVLPPHLRKSYTVASKDSWTLAGAIWDPHGYWSKAGNYLVFDHPFLKTNGCAPLFSVNPLGKQNGLSCPGPYYGINGFKLNKGLTNETESYLFKDKLSVERISLSGASQGVWEVAQGFNSNMLGNMRHFAAAKGSKYIVRYPNFPELSSVKEFPRAFDVEVTNFVDPSDELVVGFSFDGKVTPTKVMVGTNNDYPNYAGTQPSAIDFSATSSLSAVEAGNGKLYWQDKANNLVWVKLINYNFIVPVWPPNTPVDLTGDPNIYRSFGFRIR